MDEINKLYMKNKKPVIIYIWNFIISFIKVIDLLISRIMTVNLEIPMVLKGKIKWVLKAKKKKKLSKN